MKCKDCESKGCPYRNTFNNGICVYNPEKLTIFDWQSFRNQAAKDILCAMIAKFGTSSIDMNDVVKWTDNLIAKLKEKEE